MDDSKYILLVTIKYPYNYMITLDV